jgi:hypothetical protein
LMFFEGGGARAYLLLFFESALDQGNLEWEKTAR